MNIVFFGPQGSGKGTQARLLCEKYNLHYFEMGAFLRNIAETNEEVKKALGQGVLVPDEETSSYVTAYFDSKGLYDGIVFDGFPRTLAQYKILKSWLEKKSVKLDMAFVINISEKETIRRLSSRRQDPKTGKIYNLITDKPPAEIDINSLVQREDDKPETIQKRLEVYSNLTKPLIAEIGKDTKVYEIDGERPILDINKDLIKIVDALASDPSSE